jgi:hypothetical protein
VAAARKVCAARSPLCRCGVFHPHQSILGSSNNDQLFPSGRRLGLSRRLSTSAALHALRQRGRRCRRTCTNGYLRAAAEALPALKLHSTTIL